MVRYLLYSDGGYQRGIFYNIYDVWAFQEEMFNQLDTVRSTRAYRVNCIIKVMSKFKSNWCLAVKLEEYIPHFHSLGIYQVHKLYAIFEV